MWKPHVTVKTMLLMTQPRKPKKTDAKTNPANGVFLRFSEEHIAAIQAFIDAQRVAPGRATVIIKATEEFLQREGFWPPKPKG